MNFRLSHGSADDENNKKEGGERGRKEGRKEKEVFRYIPVTRNIYQD